MLLETLQLPGTVRSVGSRLARRLGLSLARMKRTHSSLSDIGTLRQAF